MSEERAKLYDENSDFVYQMGVSLMDNDLLPKDGECILDLGCGTGRLTARLASKVGLRGTVLGVDPNAGRIELARTNAQRHHQNIRFVVGLVDDMLSLGPYNGIFSNYVLHWVPDGSIHETLRGALACLKPGGLLCAHIALSPGALFDNIERLLTGNNTPRTPLYTPGEAGEKWKRLCELAGFHVSVAAEESARACLDNLDTCINVVRAYLDTHASGYAIMDNDVSSLMKAHGIKSRSDKVVTESNYVRLIAHKSPEGQ
eukprot:scpid84098/ scgid9166/ Trans-aconitate 2-methyltransferase